MSRQTKAELTRALRGIVRELEVEMKHPRAPQEESQTYRDGYCDGIDWGLHLIRSVLGERP